jgi:hypothetical protein
MSLLWPNSATLNKNSNKISSPPIELETLKLIATDNNFKIEDPPIIAKQKIKIILY